MVNGSNWMGRDHLCRWHDIMIHGPHACVSQRSTNSSSPASERQISSHQIGPSASGCSSSHMHWYGGEWVDGGGVGSLEGALMELLLRKHLDLWSHPAFTGLHFLDATWGILWAKLNITLDVVSLDRKCSLKVRKMINILTKEVKNLAQGKSWGFHSEHLEENTEGLVVSFLLFHFKTV